MYSSDDIKTAEFLIRSPDKNVELTEKERRIVNRRDIERLDKMTRYCEIDSCLRAYILKYFGETQKGRCGNCSNCNQESWWKRLFRR
jgi:ATP-dependent DNA helicase RecQ